MYDTSDRPTMRDKPLQGLEVWLIGTPSEVDAAAATLTASGHVLRTGSTRRLRGSDSGRVSRYLRLSIAVPARKTVRDNGPGLFAA